MLEGPSKRVQGGSSNNRAREPEDGPDDAAPVKRGLGRPKGSKDKKPRKRRGSAHRDPEGPAAVGWRIAIWWVDDKCFYKAVVIGHSLESGKHLVWYDDDVKEELKLADEKVQWIAAPGTFLEPTRGLPGEEGPAPTPGGPVPDRLPIICQGLHGTFLIKEVEVLLDDGTKIAPNKFEKMAGKTQTKKWKNSLRIRKKDGSPGQTLGDWLIEQGLDTPKQSTKVAGHRWGPTGPKCWYPSA